jgi:hypothetical protein
LGPQGRAYRASLGYSAWLQHAVAELGGPFGSMATPSFKKPGNDDPNRVTDLVSCRSLTDWIGFEEVPGNSPSNIAARFKPVGGPLRTASRTNEGT